MVLQLVESLGAVTGQAKLGTVSGPLTGSLDGNRLEANVTGLPMRLLVATVRNDAMSGTVRDLSGDIVDSFSAALQQPQR